MMHSVIYTKNVVAHDPKTGKKSTIPAGTRAELTEQQLQGIRHAVRVTKAKPAATGNQGKA